MSSERYKLEGSDETGAEISGIQQPRATVVAGSLDGPVVVLKVPGHSYWSGRGMQSYAPVEYQIYEVDDPHKMWWRRVVAFEPSKAKR